jgi:SpoVK/Ycf46/Vps4 family AAA+-type ATPase
MSTSRHIIALLKSHMEGEEQQFLSVALQMAAHEARKGHTQVAQEIQSLIDQAKNKKSALEKQRSATKVIQAKGELSNLLSVRYSETRFIDMVLQPSLKERLDRILIEQRNQCRLAEHNLHPRRKILLIGLPGSGKSMTASALAGELGLPLFTVMYDCLITKYMGETAHQLKLIFDAMKSDQGVYFFDEFDAIGSQRSSTNDTGEIRRVLNSFLQFLENDDSQSIIIAATNHPDLLDKALFRRFDDVIKYELPDEQIIRELLETRLSNFKLEWDNWNPIIQTSKDLSQAEIVNAASEAAKIAVISNQDSISEESLLGAITERQNSIF